MYPAVKSNAVTEEKAIEICGKELVEKVKSLSCDFTNRLIDDCYEVVEMSASVDYEDGELTILYLIPKDDTDDEDMGNWDYSNYSFVIS